MKVKYEITSGEKFWGSVNEISDAVEKGYAPKVIKLDNPHGNHQSRIIYEFDDMTHKGPISIVTDVSIALETVLFPYQYKYMGEDVMINVLLQNAEGMKWSVMIYRYPDTQNITMGDRVVFILKKAFDLVKDALIGVGTGIDKFFNDL